MTNENENENSILLIEKQINPNEKTFKTNAETISKSSETHKNASASKNKKPLFCRKKVRHHYNLTPREMQILRLLTEGDSNPVISEKLSISPHTVKSHVINIMKKINVNNRTQAAVWAVQNRVV